MVLLFFFLFLIALSTPHVHFMAVWEKVVFQRYFGHEIEKVPSRFGDVRVPSVVSTNFFSWERGFFPLSHVERGFQSEVAKHCVHTVWTFQIWMVKLTLPWTLEKGYSCVHPERSDTTHKVYQIGHNCKTCNASSHSQITLTFDTGSLNVSSSGEILWWQNVCYFENPQICKSMW